MENKTLLTAVFKILCVLLLFALVDKALDSYFNSHTGVIMHKVLGSPSSEPCFYNSCATVINLLIQQRNNVSKLLNQKQQDIGLMECSHLEETNRSQEQVTDAGGYCPIATKTKQWGFDMILAMTLAHFFKGKTVGSFGDGTGAYKRTIMRTGLAKVYDAYDGAPNCEYLSHGLVRFLDLSIPQYGLPIYDWIVSLEVAEHIPETFEGIMLDNIKRHAREGVVLSWARPKQGGYSHVNNRSPEYVAAKMEGIGFKRDIHKTKSIRNGTKFIHLRRNINVFIRKPEFMDTDLAVDA